MEQYNDTLQNGTDDYWDAFSYNKYDHIPKMCIIWYSVTLVLGVIGNGLVIWITGFRMKTVNAVWFLNLAIADFITCISLPSRIYEWILYWEYNYADDLCKAGITILFINMLCSVYFMTVISIDRCVSIYCPIWTKVHRTRCLAIVIAVLTWMFSLLISIPHMVVNHIHPYVSECIPKYFDFSGNLAQIMKKRNAMFITKNIYMFAFPFTIILLSYILLFVKLRKIRKSKKSQRPFKVITTVIVSFFICWFPYNTWPLITTSDNYWELDMLITEISICLAYFSSCVNPILYILCSQYFQKNFVKSIPNMLEKVFNDVDYRG